MARKNDAFYFDSFDRSAEYAGQAVALLSEVMHDYDPSRLQERMAQMHAIEQAADEVRHALVDELVTAFITPIDREDVALLSDYLDSVVDEIEGVLHRLYYDNVQEIRPDALDMLDKVVDEVGQMRGLVAEMRRFKRSKTLRERVFTINHVEQEADSLFVNALRDLHTTCSDPLAVFAWHEVYTQLEECADACEKVADVIDNVVMKNS